MTKSTGAACPACTAHPVRTCIGRMGSTGLWGRVLWSTGTADVLRACALQSDMARDHRHQLRFACSARDQASRRVRVAWQSRLRPHTPTRHTRAHRPRDALWTSLGGSTSGLLSVLSPPNPSHGARFFRWVADGLLGYPCLAAGSSVAARSVQSVCVAAPAYRGRGAPPHAPDARRTRPAGTSSTFTWGRRRY